MYINPKCHTTSGDVPWLVEEPRNNNKRPCCVVVDRESLKVIFNYIKPFPLPKPQMLRYWGYPAEAHAVHTEDGYILTIHHIAHGRNETLSATPKPVVFLQHCLLCSSSNWLSNLPNESLGYILADAGFDVWLGNVRGNTYGLRHEKLKPNQSKFWDLRYICNI